MSGHTRHPNIDGLIRSLYEAAEGGSGAHHHRSIMLEAAERLEDQVATIASLSGDIETLRDKFAGQALAGLLAHSFDDGTDFLHEAGPSAAAYQAYRMADAMIRARKGGV